MNKTAAAFVQGLNKSGGGSLKCVFYIIPNIFLNFIQTLVNNPPIVKYCVDEISIFLMHCVSIPTVDKLCNYHKPLNVLQTYIA